MNRLPRKLVLWCLASGFLVVVSCRRQEPALTTPANQDQPLAPSRPLVAEESSTSSTPPGQLQSAKPEPSRAVVPERTTPVKPPPTPTERLATPKTGGAKKRQADELFDHPTALHIQIEVPQEGWNALRRTRWERGDRPVAKAVVREGDHVYTNVAVHLKGAVGSFRSIDNKPALTLKFDKFAPEQRFHGLNKISLNNSVQDSTYLSEKIAREMFLKAGVPTPRAAHATVALNGKYLGLYVLLEGANKRFLKAHFENPTGNLYDGGFCRDIGSRLTINSGDDPSNTSGLKALRAAVRNPTYSKLEQVLDMDRFVSMLAMEMLLGHWDGYTLNKNNWRVFHDLQSNRMVFIPHGLDQLFGGGRQIDQNASLLPENVQGQVSRAVLSTPEGQRLYRQRLVQLYRDVFNVEEMAARVDEIVAGVSSALAKVDPDSARTFKQRGNAFKHRVTRRAATLRQSLGVPLEPMKFASDGVLKLTGWKKALVQSGDPELTETEDDRGHVLLGVKANGESSGSWRTRVVLAPGGYQLEGQMRAQEVTVKEGDQRSGAGLRISKGAMPPKLTGSSDWKLFKHAFTVEDQATEVELVCELKALGGEVWFDANTLRLVQVR